MAKKVKVLIEVTVEPAVGNTSEFWDLGASASMIAAEIAERMLGVEEDGHRYVRVFDHVCTLKSVRG